MYFYVVPFHLCKPGLAIDKYLHLTSLLIINYSNAKGRFYFVYLVWLVEKLKYSLKEVAES